jgi:hypothetical protein
MSGTKEDTITVEQLIAQLQKVDGKLPVNIVGVGLTDSWYAPLYFGDDTVEVHDGICEIIMSAVG